jgi:hypothetical protein
MKKLKREDLVEGEIYKASNTCLTFIIKATKNLKNVINIPSYNAFMKSGNFNAPYLTFTNATPEEKHWLEACIAANSFISYEEAVKTFVYKYYKIIENKISSNYNNNVIYSRNTIFGHFNGDNRIIKKIEIGKHNSNSTIDVLYGEIGEQKVCFDMKALQPSTKEAYDAQFVIKEPEFVLPKSWCIKVNEKTRPYIKEYRQSINYKPYEIGHYLYQSQFCGNNSPTGEILSLEQFKKYVLKKQLEEPKDKVLDYHSSGVKIKKVESSEGAIFELGDKITVFTKDSPNKGRVLTIKDFRWNNAKTDICAITEVHNKNGIGLDKIELYSEPIKKELSLIEQAKLKYPVGIKVTNRVASMFDENDHLYPGDFIIDTQNFEEIENFITIDLISGEIRTIYNKMNNSWAEIVEDFKLPENWCVRGGLNVCETLKSYFNSIGKDKYNWKFDSNSYVYFEDTENVQNRLSPGENQIEITFEQFEQYVLHNGFKVGDIISNGNKIIYDLQYLDGHSVAFYKYVESGNTDNHCRILTKNIVR